MRSWAEPTGSQSVTSCSLTTMPSAIALSRGDLERAEAHAQAELEMSRALAAHDFGVWALVSLGHVERSRGMLDSARVSYEEALALAREMGETQRRLRRRAPWVRLLFSRGTSIVRPISRNSQSIWPRAHSGTREWQTGSSNLPRRTWRRVGSPKRPRLCTEPRLSSREFLSPRLPQPSSRSPA